MESCYQIKLTYINLHYMILWIITINNKIIENNFFLSSELGLNISE